MKYNKFSFQLYIFIFIFISFMCYIIYNLSENEQQYLKLFTNKTEGTVVEYELETYRRRPSHHIMTIDYEIDGEKYRITDSYFGSKEKVCNIGEKIDILYIEDHPEYIFPKFSLDYQMEREKEYRIIFILLPLSVCVAFYFDYSKNKHKIKY